MFRYPCLNCGALAGLGTSIIATAASGDLNSVVASLSALVACVVGCVVWALRFVLVQHGQKLAGIDQSLKGVASSVKQLSEAVKALQEAHNQDETINRVEKPG
jgi:hypothetical protein